MSFAQYRATLAGFASRLTDHQSLLGQVSLAFSTYVAIAILNFVSSLLAARLLGPTGRGELAAIQSWSMFLAALAMIGMPEAIVYFTSRSRTDARAIVVRGMTIVAAISGIVVLVGWLLMPLLLDAQRPAVVRVARETLIVSVLISIVGALPHHALRAIGAWRTWNVLRLLPALTWMIALSLAVIAWRDISSIGVGRLYLVSSVILAPVLFVVSWRRLASPPTKSPAEPIVSRRTMLAFGLPTALSVIPQTLNLRLDQMLMAGFIAPDALGLYAVAVGWAAAGSPIFSAVSAVIFPRLSAIPHPEEQWRVLRRLLPLLLGGIGLISLFLAIITPFALPALFGDSYRDAVPAALILIVANGASSLNQVLEACLQGLGRPRVIFVAEISGLVVTGVLLFILLERFEIIGAAVASLGAYLVVTAILVAALTNLQRQSDSAVRG